MEKLHHQDLSGTADNDSCRNRSTRRNALGAHAGSQEANSPSQRKVPPSCRWSATSPSPAKFTYAFGIISLLCAGLGAYTLLTFRSMAAKTEEVSGNHLPSLINIANIREGVNVERREDLELLLVARRRRAQRITPTTAPEGPLAEYQDETACDGSAP